MEKAFENFNWANEPSHATPLSATNLNKINGALNTIDDRVIRHDSDIENNKTARHTHSNKSILDSITQTMINLIGTISSKYVKPSSGIPKTDLATDVQASLTKADTIAQNYIKYRIEEVV